MFERTMHTATAKGCHEEAGSTKVLCLNRPTRLSITSTALLRQPKWSHARLFAY